MEFKLPWREAGPPNLHDDKVDSDQYVVNKELSARERGGGLRLESGVQSFGSDGSGLRVGRVAGWKSRAAG